MAIEVAIEWFSIEGRTLLVAIEVAIEWFSIKETFSVSKECFNALQSSKFGTYIVQLVLRA